MLLDRFNGDKIAFQNLSNCYHFFSHDHAISEAVTRRCSVKKVCLEISQNSQENACARTPSVAASAISNPTCDVLTMLMLITFFHLGRVRKAF